MNTIIICILFNLLTISNLFGFSFTTTTSQFFTITKNNTVEAYGYFIPNIDQKKLPLNSNSAWKTFHNSAFKLKYLLQQAAQTNKPAILLIPQDHHKSKTTSTYAPWIEGTRVALTWASAYHRFAKLGNADVRIVLFDKNDNLTQSNIIHVLDQITSIKIIDNPNETPESHIEKRVFDFNSLLNTEKRNGQFSLNPLKIRMPQKTNPIIVEPQLANLAHNQKRILLVGGAGFIGSYLTRELLKQGHQVIVVDNLSCCTAKHVTQLKDNSNFSFHQLDASQPFDIEGPLTHIVHLASIPTPPLYYKMPKETLVTGLDCTKITVKLAHKKNACYLFASTSEVYGDPEINPQPETYAGRVNPIGKRSQYDESKRGAETLLKLYFEKYNMDIRIMRIFNTYGPYMQINDGRVVTNFIKAVLDNKEMTIYGSGKQSRSFSYVSDTVDGILKLLFAGNLENNSIDQRIFNIGNTEEYSILDLANIVNVIAKQNLNTLVPIKHIKQFDKDDPKVRQPDLSKIRKKLGYNPKIDIFKGVKKTLTFFMKKK